MIDNIPIGSDTKDAPWNQPDNEEREIEVAVSITLSKNFKIKVSDYEVINSGKDEDGNYYEDIDYSNCNLEEEVKNQIYLPYEASDYIDDSQKKRIKRDLANWNIDDFEVIID